MKHAHAIELSYPHTGLPGEGGSGASGGNLVVGIIANFMQWLLLLLGAFCIISFVISGILYLTSAGDEDRAERGKRGMIYSILGVIIGLAGFVIIKAINTWLSGGNNRF